MGLESSEYSRESADKKISSTCYLFLIPLYHWKHINLHAWVLTMCDIMALALLAYNGMSGLLKR